MNNANRLFWSFNFVSALGVLPFLLLPSIANNPHVGGALVVVTIAYIGACLTIGEIIAGVAAPLIIKDHFEPRIAIALTLVLAALFSVTSTSLTTRSLASWVFVGILAGTLQYYGTTFSLFMEDPKRASKFRLILSLTASGTIISATAIWHGVAFQVLQLCCFVLCLISAALIHFSTKSITVLEYEKREDRGKSPFFFIIACVSVLSFFFFYAPFSALLPSLIWKQSSSITLLQMGLGKILAAAFMCFTDWKKISLPFRESIAVISIPLCTAIILAPLIPSTLTFLVLEVGINSFVAHILGRCAVNLSTSQKTWMFTMIQVGCLMGYLALNISGILIDLRVVGLVAAVPIVITLIMPRASKCPR